MDAPKINPNITCLIVSLEIVVSYYRPPTSPTTNIERDHESSKSDVVHQYLAYSVAPENHLLSLAIWLRRHGLLVVCRGCSDLVEYSLTAITCLLYSVSLYIPL